jgi:predicted nuclease of predicted toxin-antitoxin system
VPDALRNAGFPTIAHDEVFTDQTTPDEVWLDEAGNNGWIVVSRDKMIRRKSNELDAFKRHRVRAVFISGKNITGQEMSELLVKRGRKIQDTLMSSRAPAAYTLGRDGKLTKIAI